MSDVPFSVYGFNTDEPPVLNTAWNEQKRIVDLNEKSYVFITSLYSSPWQERHRFPNSDRSTLFYYWSKYGDCRIKRSRHWSANDKRAFGGTGSYESEIFGKTKWKFQ